MKVNRDLTDYLKKYFTDTVREKLLKHIENIEHTNCKQYIGRSGHPIIDATYWVGDRSFIVRRLMHYIKYGKACDGFIRITCNERACVNADHLSVYETKVNRAVHAKLDQKKSSAEIEFERLVTHYEEPKPLPVSHDTKAITIFTAQEQKLTFNPGDILKAYNGKSVYVLLKDGSIAEINS